MTREISGYLFDVRARANGGVSVWILDTAGVMHQLRDTLTMSFYVGGARENLDRVGEWLKGAQLPVTLNYVQRYDLTLRRNILVLEVRVIVPAMYQRVVKRVTDTFPTLDYYNCDLLVSQVYCFARGVFPIACCDLAVDDANNILEIAVNDSQWALDYAIPPLRVMSIHMEGDTAYPKNPRHGFRGPIELEYDGHSYTLGTGNSEELLLSLRKHLTRYDPDVILSCFGDDFIFPELRMLSWRHAIPLPWNRNGQQPRWHEREQSYSTYGRTMFRPGGQTLVGRWHIDVENTYLLHEYQLPGLLELARITQLPVQRAARRTTGAGVTGMEVAAAYQKGYLIPRRPKESEGWKTALDLYRLDKAGLTFTPYGGIHYEVGVYDFTALYPLIMWRYNISPEKIRCDCCPPIPGLGYAICQKEKGFVPEGMEPLVWKRLRYKEALRRELPSEKEDLYRCRSTANKWLCVVWYGHRRHKHALWASIEAHEATAYIGRRALLRAKDEVERAGFVFLHGLNDSLWVRKPGATLEDYKALGERIERATGLPICFEGLCKWVAFLYSRQDPRRTVPHRYFQARGDGTWKARGIEVRRRDTQAFIKRVQEELLNELAKTTTRSEVTAILPQLMDIVAAAVDRLRSGQVPHHELLLTYRLSRNPEEFRMQTLNAIVAKQLTDRGVKLHAGEQIQYIVTENDSPVPEQRACAWELTNDFTEYDVKYYTERLIRAAETILSPFGVSEAILRDWLAKALPVPQVQKRLEAFRMRQYLGPLFEFAYQEEIRQREANRLSDQLHVPQGRRGARNLVAVGASS